MHFIALCVAIIALAHLPQACEIGWWIICQLAKILGYVLAAALSVGFFVWIL